VAYKLTMAVMTCFFLSLQQSAQHGPVPSVASQEVVSTDSLSQGAGRRFAERFRGHLAEIGFPSKS